jgi:hypothetical protein
MVKKKEKKLIFENLGLFYSQVEEEEEVGCE